MAYGKTLEKENVQKVSDNNDKEKHFTIDKYNKLMHRRIEGYYTHKGICGISNEKRKNI